MVQVSAMRASLACTCDNKNNQITTGLHMCVCQVGELEILHVRAELAALRHEHHRPRPFIPAAYRRKHIQRAARCSWRKLGTGCIGAPLAAPI